jgi:hypothetical protein
MRQGWWRRREPRREPWFKPQNARTERTLPAKWATHNAEAGDRPFRRQSVELYLDRLIIGHSWSDNEQPPGSCRDGPFELERACALSLRTAAPASSRDVRGSHVIGQCPQWPGRFDRLAGWEELRELLGGMEDDGTLPHLYRRHVEPASGAKLDGLRNSEDTHQRAVILDHGLNLRHRGSEGHRRTPRQFWRGSVTVMPTSVPRHGERPRQRGCQARPMRSPRSCLRGR